MKAYTRFVVEEEWAVQRRGEVPGRQGVDLNLAFQRRLNRCDPATPGQQALHADTLRLFSRMIELRRARLQAVTAALPASMWWVIAIGAVLTTASG